MARMIFVFNDGDTWCDASDGCITIVTNEGYDRLVDGDRPQDLGEDAILDAGIRVFPTTGV